jgi:hypothetical protein
MWFPVVCLQLGVLSFATVDAAEAAPSRSHSTHKVVAKPASDTSKDKSLAMKSPPDFSAMLGLFDKLFPPQPDPDPARLALARTAVSTMWSDGTYGRMMTGMLGGAFDRAMTLKQSDLAALGGKTPKAGAGVGVREPSIHDTAAAKDPNFDRRVADIRGIVTDEMGKISAIIDPRVRDGLARSMARRFDSAQLTDIDAFFATPSGHALASQYMQIWVDPDMMRSLFGSLPDMMKLMPEMAQKIKAAEEKYPKPATAAIPKPSKT